MSALGEPRRSETSLTSAARHRACPDASQRPADEDYERLSLARRAAQSTSCDKDEIQSRHQFLVKDVFFSAVSANAALLELAEIVGASDDDAHGGGIGGTPWRGRPVGRQLELCARLQHTRPDVHPGAHLSPGLRPFLLEISNSEREARVLAQLDSDYFTSSPSAPLGVLPSTTSRSPASSHATTGGVPDVANRRLVRMAALRPRRS